jgi:hypothetical protein
MADELIRESALRELRAAGTPVRFRLLGQSGGYTLEVIGEAYRRRLATARGALRVFTLDSGAAYVRALGVDSFEVDTARYAPGRIRKPRPDRAAALRGTRTRLRQASLL